MEHEAQGHRWLLFLPGLILLIIALYCDSLTVASHQTLHPISFTDYAYVLEGLALYYISALALYYLSLKAWIAIGCALSVSLIAELPMNLAVGLTDVITKLPQLLLGMSALFFMYLLPMLVLHNEG